NLGFSLKDIRVLLSLYQDRNRTSRDVKRLALQHVAEVDRRIAELHAVRTALAELAQRCHGDDRPQCPILDELEAMDH
ncbi:MAG: MerR family DNA-binding protein, partial [Alphaproteobacteria bacterium]|nr:MerR family DNA-binding protein [Alphaproteobacteria bacterium]